MKKNLVVRVKEIKGNCPVFKVGDKFLIENGYILKLEKPICMHSLTSIMPYYIALSRGVKPEDLGIGKNNKAYVQCLDPCEYTGGGTVIFEVSVEE
jgi:uncharacterized repeat protein (TIGR04076 family)